MLDFAAGLLKATVLVFALKPKDRAQADSGWQRPEEVPPAQTVTPSTHEVIDLDEKRQAKSRKAQVKPPLSAPYRPSTAARLFIEWMQDNEFLGEHQWATRNDLPGKPLGIWEMYNWHCREVNTTPIAENIFAQALGKLCKKRQIRDRTSGKLQRLAVYRIAERAEPKIKKKRRSTRPFKACATRTIRRAA